MYSSRDDRAVTTKPLKIKILPGSVESTGLFWAGVFLSDLMSSPFFLSLVPSRNSDPGSHSRLFCPLAFFFARRFQLFLPSSTRVEVYLPTLGALSSFLSFFFIFANNFKISPRRDSNSRTNTTNSSIRGLPLDHPSDRLLCLRKYPACVYSILILYPFCARPRFLFFL